jgi:phosphopantothenoylcysteine decarboxylase/phosphopantothenate--cysteine ligase
VKLVRKDLDALVVNDISRADIGFDSQENEVTILLRSRNGGAGDGKADLHVGKSSKRAVAGAILDAVEELLEAGKM